jgi:hypothetical protein
VAGGAQVVLAAILKPGDALSVPALTYPGLRMAAERCGVRLVPVACDSDGLDPEAFLERCKAERPRALYLVPAFDNHTTATLPRARRERVAEVARSHGVAIIEDDAHGALPSEAPAPIAAFAGDTTWHVAMFSKCISSGLRIAYVAVPGTNDAANGWRCRASAREDGARAENDPRDGAGGVLAQARPALARDQSVRLGTRRAAFHRAQISFEPRSRLEILHARETLAGRRLSSSPALSDRRPMSKAITGDAV